MTALYTVMATGGGIKNLIPVILAGVIGVILLIALIIGVKKGARKVSWTGACWLSACVAFFLTFKKLGGKINGMLAPKLARLVSEATAEFICALLLAVACALGVLLVSGIFAMIFRPKIKWVKKDSDAYTLDEDGVEYDEEYGDYDDYEDYETRKEAVKKGYGTPSVFGRILGGLLCMLNVAMILGASVCLLILIANATALKNGVFSGLFAWKIGKFAVVEKLLGYAQKYALDALFIGILVGYACKGNKKGFMTTLRDLLVKFGGLIAVCAGFYLPFSKFALPTEQGGWYYLNKLVTRCDGAFKGLLGENMPMLAPVFAKIFTGLLLVGAIILVLLLLGWLMKKASEGIEKVAWLKVVDGSISGVTYIVFGAILCVLVWALMYVLGYYNILRLNELLVQETSLSRSLLATCENYIKPILDKVSQIIAKFKLPV